MESEEYQKQYYLERNHWWFKGVRKILFVLLNKYEEKRNLRILDVGCGTGIIIKKLERYGEVEGIDISEDALKFCRKRGIKKLKKASVEELPFEKNVFDIVTSIDVIYHSWVNSDEKAIEEMNRVLKKGGLLIIQVAAYNFIDSNHDRMVFTKRRYTKNKLKNKLEKNGFKIKKITYMNFFLFPIIIIKRFLEKKRDESDVKKENKLINSSLTKLLYLEAFLLKYINFPFGLSILCVAKKEI